MRLPSEGLHARFYMLVMHLLLEHNLEVAWKNTMTRIRITQMTVARYMKWPRIGMEFVQSLHVCQDEDLAHE